MNDPLDTFLTIAGYLTLLVSPVAGAAAVYYLAKTVKNVKPGVSARSRQTLWNPFNVVARPSLLTEEGLRCRRRLLVSTVLIFAIPTLMLALSVLFLEAPSS